MNPKDRYSLQDWARLFLLATLAKETRDYSLVKSWVSKHSITHDLPEPDDNDIKYLVEEALQFLEKFSENHIDNMYNR